jgi:hypothetical protein
MTQCESTDFLYPLLMDIYYPIVDQGGYGNLKKQWVLDRTLACAFGPSGLKNKKDIQPDAKIDIDNAIVGRVRTDITSTSRGSLNSLTNIVVTNIRDINGNVIYNESSGPRAGMATVFEVGTFNPSIGPFGSTEYYKIILRRSENQAVDL